MRSKERPKNVLTIPTRAHSLAPSRETTACANVGKKRRAVILIRTGWRGVGREIHTIPAGPRCGSRIRTNAGSDAGRVHPWLARSDIHERCAASAAWVLMRVPGIGEAHNEEWISSCGR